MYIYIFVYMLTINLPISLNLHCFQDGETCSVLLFPVVTQTQSCEKQTVVDKFSIFIQTTKNVKPFLFIYFFPGWPQIFAAYVVRIKLWVFLNVCSERAQQASTDQLTHLQRCTDTHWNLSVLFCSAIFQNQKSCGSVDHSSYAKSCHTAQESFH